MQPFDFERISILGAARSGLAAADLLAQNDRRVFVSDCRPLEFCISAHTHLESKNIESEFGRHTARILEADCLVVSPGIPPEIGILQQARERGIPIVGELEVATYFWPGKIVAVTGSNGKSTTSALLGAMFDAARAAHIVAGNIGLPFSEVVRSGTPDATAILEVSSFQLETISLFKPEIGVLLNISSDHLDRHGSLAQYAKAKLRLFENQTENDFAVYNSDDQQCRNLCNQIRATAVPFHAGAQLEQGCFVVAGKIIFAFGSSSETIIEVHDLRLPGPHNLANALAAVAAARLSGLSGTAITAALQTFSGLEHRLELVRTKNDIQYVNDSKATNPASLAVALQSFQGPIILIAGGKDKGDDFSHLRPLAASRVKGIILLGETSSKLAAAMCASDKTVMVNSLEEAVAEAANRSQPGDVVLLSPGCSSFDMFENFEDRGRQFKALVQTNL